MWTDKQSSNIDDFINMLKTLDWFKVAGDASDEFTVIHSIYHAWDNWNKEMLKVWHIESHKLEEEALKI